jgi:hypothetical protein
MGYKCLKTQLKQCGQPWVATLCNAACIRRAIQRLLHAVERTG